MSDQWQEYMGRKRRRSVRKSGNKKTKSDNSIIDTSNVYDGQKNDPVVSVSVSETVSVIHKAKETLFDDNPNMALRTTLPGTNMIAAGQPMQGIIAVGQPTPGAIVGQPILGSTTTTTASSSPS